MGNADESRSLSMRQKKILQAFADDFEGREPQIHFGPPPSAPPSPASPSTTTTGQPKDTGSGTGTEGKDPLGSPHSSSSSSAPGPSNSRSSERPTPKSAPFVHTEPVRPHSSSRETSTTEKGSGNGHGGEAGGFVHSLAEGLGKVIGWAERLFGNGNGSGPGSGGGGKRR